MCVKCNIKKYQRDDLFCSSSTSSTAARTAAMTKAEKVQSFPWIRDSTRSIRSFGNRMVLFVVGGLEGILKDMRYTSQSIYWFSLIYQISLLCKEKKKRTHICECVIVCRFNLLAETVGFEPTCLSLDKTISSRSRYDHFDTSPYLIVVRKFRYTRRFICCRRFQWSLYSITDFRLTFKTFPKKDSIKRSHCSQSKTVESIFQIVRFKTIALFFYLQKPVKKK